MRIDEVITALKGIAAASLAGDNEAVHSEAATLIEDLTRLGPAVALVTWRFDLENCPLEPHPVLISRHDPADRVWLSRKYKSRENPNGYRWQGQHSQFTPLAWCELPLSALRVLS